MSVWLSNGEIVMDNGQIIVCDECPCTGTSTGTVLVPQPCEVCPDGNGVANGMVFDISGFANNTGMPPGCNCPAFDGSYVVPLTSDGCSGTEAFELCTFGTTYWLFLSWSFAEPSPATIPPSWLLTVTVFITYGYSLPGAQCSYSVYRASGTDNCFEVDNLAVPFVAGSDWSYFYCCLLDGLTIHATAY